MIAVADAGPLIALAKIGGLDALFELYSQVLTPPAVYAEAVTAGLVTVAADAAVLEAAYQRGKLEVRAPSRTTLPSPALLGLGEDESIRLAIDQSAEWLLMDDLDARRAAEANFAAAGAPTAVRGTLGILVSAFQQGHITNDQTIELIEALRGRPDIWVSAELCNRVIEALKRGR